MSEPIKLHDLKPATDNVLEDVHAGLTSPVKSLPARLFYDERGSQLFERITETPEYYPTRTETAIMRRHADRMAELIGRGAMLVEFGSGSSSKTRILLDHAQDLAAYVPIDISREHLLEWAEQIARDHEDLEVLPVCADYERPYTLPVPKKPVRSRVMYFPGSTIGNFHPDGAVAFMRDVKAHATEGGSRGAFLVGVDLKKDRRRLDAAYNDAQGVTAAFNLNMLLHINAETGADFDIDLYRHVAFYNEEAGRIEMHLESLSDHTVTIGGREIRFGEGERIWTESSYKYTEEEFAAMAERAGFEVHTVWTDDDKLFSVQFLAAA